MRTTLKAQAIRLIAIFLLICASTTTVKAQISQHPELYKVKEFHNMDKDGGAYYCFTDAQYYQGKLYGVYIDNNGPSSIRLIAFEVNGETRTMEQSTVGDTGKKMIFLNDFGVYQDAEIIVYRNRFYVLWKNNTNGQIWIGEVDMKKGEYKKTRMLDDGKTYANFAATIYRDKICVILHRRTNKKLQVYQYGDPELNSGWDWCGTVRNAGHDNIELKGSTGISMEYDPDDHWDATSWYGYDDTEKKNVEKLIIGRLKSGTFEAFSYSGEYGKDNIWPSNWEEYAHHDIGRSKTFSLKLIQADIEGYAADNTSGYKASSNPLIFSYCTYDGKGTGEHFLKKFYPGSNSFATDAPIYTDLPYGYTVVATAADPTTETAPGGGLYYKQYIYLLRGNQTPYHWYKHAYIASIRSNEIVERRSSFNDEKALFGNSELRNLVRLVGIIEGPPPTVVDNNEWFGDLGVASSLAFTMGSGTSNSVSRLYKSDLKCSFGPHTDKLTAAFGGGYSFQKQHEEVTSQSESITVTFEANDTADYRAIALYSVPILTRCDLEYLSPTRRQSVRMPIFSYTYMTRQSIKQVEVPLDLEPFRIDNPSKLGDWEAREILTMTASEPNVSKSVNFSLNSERIDMTLETSGTISDSQTKGAISLMDLKFPFFQLENQSSWEWTDQTTATTSQGISASYSKIRRTDKHVRPEETAESFSSTLYLLTAEKSNTLRDQYYPKLLERKISFGTDTFPFMVNSDKPFVLAWDINNITYVRGNVSITGNEVVTTDEPLSIRFLDGMLTVDCLPGATVNVYSMNGTLTGHQQAVSGKAIFSLPGHLYTVEVVTERYRKVQKVVR